MAERHCGTCLCVEMAAVGAAEELTDEAIEAAEAAEKAGTEPGHEHCPDCGCNRQNHTEHADGCRRIGTSVELQCGPPWTPVAPVVTSQKPPSARCLLVAPGNWNTSGWVPVCRLAAGHEDDHVSDGPFVFPANGRPRRAADYTWRNHVAPAPGVAVGCEHLDGPYRRLLAERDRLAGALGAVRQVVGADAELPGGTQYTDGRRDVARAVLRTLDALTTTDEETTR